jgi:hypothetical protein
VRRSATLMLLFVKENTQEMVDRLREICPVWVTNIISIEDK